MEKTFFARVVAKAINFPDVIEMNYIRLNAAGAPTGEIYDGIYFNWEEVKDLFWVDQESAQEHEEYFYDGDSAFLGNRRITITVDDPVN